MNVTHLGATFLALVVATLAPATTEAQWPDDRFSVAHSDGYRDGGRAGAEDARDGRPFEYQRHRDYRDADRGYQSRDGRRDDYTRQYRAGFITGYRDGYNGGGGRGSGGYGPPTGPRGGPAYGRSGRVFGGASGGGANRGRATLAEIAFANGLDEGYRKGFDDGRDGDRYDVSRHGAYRRADDGYRREFGSRQHYERAYRAAFERGYDNGYRDGQRDRGRGWRW